MIKILIKIFFSVILTFMFVSCASLQINLDKYSLRRNKNAILKNFSPGDPVKLENYVNNFDLDSLTAVPAGSAPSRIIPLQKWHLKTGISLTYEKWIFKNSSFASPVPGDAEFYVIKQKPLNNSRVIIWVPGFGVSDFAFRWIKNFFYAEIDAGYNIVIYIPPYHLERQEKGKDPGSGLLTSSPLHTVKTLVNAVKELRMAYRYLQNQNVISIGTWGGSMGGALTLMLQSLETIDHMALMIPVLDWNTFIMPEGLFPRYKDAGFTKESIRRIYNLISPVSYGLTVPPDRMFIEAAEFDQLNPLQDVINYTQKYGIKNFHIYPAGHVAILLQKNIYRDYTDFLQNLP